MPHRRSRHLGSSISIRHEAGSWQCGRSSSLPAQNVPVLHVQVFCDLMYCFIVRSLPCALRSISLPCKGQKCGGIECQVSSFCHVCCAAAVSFSGLKGTERSQGGGALRVSRASLSGSKARGNGHRSGCGGSSGESLESEERYVAPSTATRAQ